MGAVEDELRTGQGEKPEEETALLILSDAWQGQNNSNSARVWGATFTVNVSRIRLQLLLLIQTTPSTVKEKPNVH